MRAARHRRVAGNKCAVGLVRRRGLPAVGTYLTVGVVQIPPRRPVHRSSHRRGLVAQTGVPFEVKKPLSECEVGDTSSHDGVPPWRAVAAQRAMKRGAYRGGELLVRVAWWAAAGGARVQKFKPAKPAA